MSNKQVIESLKNVIQVFTDPSNVIHFKLGFIKIVEILVKIDLYHSLNCSTDWRALTIWIKNYVHAKVLKF